MPHEHYSCVVLLPHLRIQAANAISSPMTWGFPAISAFTGFAHALERKMREGGRDLRFQGVGVVCHSAEPQIADNSFFAPRSFSLTRNPVDEHGDTAAIVEEGRVHLTVSLLLTVDGGDAPTNAGLAAKLADELLELALGMRLAGGSVFRSEVPRNVRARAWVSDNFADEDPQVPRLMRQLLPGFALVSRGDLLIEHLEELRATQPDATTLDALLDFARMHYAAPPPSAEGDTEVEWPDPKRVKAGWLVPISVGYGAISELHAPGTVTGARDRTIPFRFVESLLSLGQWLSPHRIKSIEDLLWRHQAEPDAGLYRVVNQYQS